MRGHIHRAHGALALAVLGCTGSVGDPPSTPTTHTCDPTQLEPGPTLLRRLTPLEYAHAVATVTGVDVSTEALTLPLDEVVEGFDNNASVLAITPLHARKYQEIAEVVGQTVMLPEYRSSLVGCDSVDESCVRTIAERLGRRAFRRPLSSTELDALVSLGNAAEGADPYNRIRLIVEGMLQAPQFLFRVEVGEPARDRPGFLELSGYEVATRLAFTLWQAPPDDVLLDAAAAGQLDTPEGLREVARAMMNIESARDGIRVFGHQWLKLPELAETTFNPAVFPEWSPAVRDAAFAELSLLVDDYLWSDSSALGLYTSSHGYSNEALASVYGTGSSASPARVNWPPDSERGGLFGNAGFLMLTSSFSTTSIVRRGLFVRETVLCDPPPPPPQDVEFVMPDPSESTANAFEQHSTNPTCRACHARMDPIGLGLERFDAIGRLRTTYPDGTPVTAEGSVEGLEPSAFAGARELGELVAASDMAPRCMVENYLRWAFGRALTEVDGCTIEAVTQSFAESGYRFQEMILAIIESDAFRYRRAGP